MVPVASERLSYEEIRLRVISLVIGFLLLVAIPLSWGAFGADPGDQGRPASCTSTSSGPSACFR